MRKQKGVLLRCLFTCWTANTVREVGANVGLPNIIGIILGIKVGRDDMIGTALGDGVGIVEVF
jgi:hypothetical protein